MFGSLKKRLKSVFGAAGDEAVKEGPPEAMPQKEEKSVKDELVTEEVVDTMKGDEKIREQVSADLSDEDLKEITPISLPKEPVKITPEGQKIREKMIKEYKGKAFRKGFESKETYRETAEVEKPVSLVSEEVPEDIEAISGQIDKETGLLKRFKKTVTEKTLSESDINPIVEELKNALLENDVALKVAEEICEHVKKQLIESSVPRSKIAQEVKEALKKSMRLVLKQTAPDISTLIEQKADNEPLVVLFLGFNGSGKTTTMAKLAKKYSQYKPVFAAADTFRAASVEQVEKHGERLNVDVVKHQYGADPAAVVFDAIKHAKSIGSRLVLADSAGRTHENANLMDELKKIVRVNNPDLRILVLDALTGNDIYDQSIKFNEAVDVDAVILTKADVYTKGGAALSTSHTIGKPIMFLGTGQGYDDLVKFDPDKIVENLLG